MDPIAATTTVFTNLLPFLEQALVAVSVLSWMFGFGMMGYVGYRMAFSHKPGGQAYNEIGFGKAFGLLLLASMLMTLPKVVSNTDALMLGGQTGYRTALAGAASMSGGSAFWTLVLQVIVMFVIVFGAVSVARGISQWFSAGNGGGSRGGGDLFWSGLWHIVFGSILVSIGSFLP